MSQGNYNYPMDGRCNVNDRMKPYTLGAHKAYRWMRGIMRNAMVIVTCLCTAVHATYDRGYL